MLFLARRRTTPALVITATLITASITPVAGARQGAILITAGDIADCQVSRDEAVGRLIAERSGVVVTLGDNAYTEGSRSQFRKCYDPAWGGFKDRTRPSPGNHDYMTHAAAGYFDYFGSAAGPGDRGYYAFKRGTWRIYSLNSELITSEQLAWLRDDLAAHPTDCVLAYFHQPLFSSREDGGVPTVRPFWEILYEAGTDVILSGHAHSYERFAPQTPDGAPNDAGIRQFVVGTGGAPQRPFGDVAANSEVRKTGTWGALQLRLADGSYFWKFLRAAGKAFSDSGSGTCH